MGQVLSKQEEQMLRWFSKETYCIYIGSSKERDNLVKKGYLEWVPSTGWNGESNYALTEKGRKYRGFE